MKTSSSYEDELDGLGGPGASDARWTSPADDGPAGAERTSRFVSAEDLSLQRLEAQRQKWKESQASLAGSEAAAPRDPCGHARAEPPAAEPPGPDVTKDIDPDERWSSAPTSPPSSEVSRDVTHDETHDERWSDSATSPPESDASLAAGGGRADRWSECRASPPGPGDPPSEPYYTASSEPSLWSEPEPERAARESPDREEGKECVMAGHVAAMRERFESMTRANTPCPDTVRSASPALDLGRDVTPSPDPLG